MTIGSFINILKSEIASVLEKHKTLDLRVDANRSELCNAIIKSIKESVITETTNLSTQIRVQTKKLIDDLFHNNTSLDLNDKNLK